MQSIDRLDLEIAKILDSDGRASNREIARRLGISETTVRHRLGRMIDSGMLTVSAQFDIEEFPEIYMAVIGVKLNVPLDRCLDKFRAIPAVLYVLTITGRYDLQVAILVNSRKMLARVVSHEIEMIEGVEDTETSVVLENVGLRISAAKLCELLNGAVHSLPNSCAGDADDD
jgi:Lrp/AsnC family transcriptional regulator, regulator for asnA, asnC and gidA